VGKIIAAFVMISAAAGFAAAQTAVEYSLGVGRAGAAAGVGKSAGGVFDKLGRTLGKTTAAEGSEARVVTVTTRAEPVAAVKQPKPVYEDPSGIQEGIDAAELTRRFGDPLFKTNAPDGATRYVYTNSESEFTLLVKDSKVISVSRAPKPQQAGIVILK
jgi:hypothetical protein